MEEGVVVSFPVTSFLGGEAALLGGEAVDPLMEEGVIASLAVTAALLGGENVNPLALEGVVPSLLLGERPVKKPLFGMIL